MKRRLPVLVIVLVIAATLLSVRMKRLREKNGAPLLRSVPPAVRTVTVERRAVSGSRHVLGVVLGADEAEVAPRVMARVVEVLVREGEAVTRGQVLARLDDREQQDAVAAARAALDAARIAADAQRDATARDKILFEAKAISQEQWDRSRAREADLAARLAAARKNLKVALARLSYTELTAPVAGVVARRLVDPGDLAVPGKPAFAVVRQTAVRVRAKLPQEDMARLRVGQAVHMSVGDEEITAPVSRIFPTADRNHLVTFEVDLADPPPGFVAGATVGMDIAFTAAEGIAVPVTALLEAETGDWVFKVSDRKIRPVRVRVLASGSDAAVVSGELAAGDTVVVARPSRLMMLGDGQEVRPVQQGGQP